MLSPKQSEYCLEWKLCTSHGPTTDFCSAFWLRTAGFGRLHSGIIPVKEKKDLKKKACALIVSPPLSPLVGCFLKTAAFMY